MTPEAANAILRELAIGLVRGKIPLRVALLGDAGIAEAWSVATDDDGMRSLLRQLTASGLRWPTTKRWVCADLGMSCTRYLCRGCCDAARRIQPTLPTLAEMVAACTALA